MSRLKAWKALLLNNWRRIVSWGVLLTATVSLYVWRLGSLNRGISNQELSYINSTRSLNDLLASPSFMIHKVVTYCLSKVGITQVTSFRLISVAFGLTAAFSVFYILHKWYTTRVSLLGTLLFASSSIVLHASRSASPSVSFLLIAPIIATGLWLQRTRRYQRALLVLTTCLCLTIYTPGFIWIALLVLIWQGKRILRVFVRSPLWLQTMSVFTVLLLLTPGVISLVLHPVEILSVLGLPSKLPTISVQAEHIKTSLLGIFWRYNADTPSLWVDHTPWFDILTSAMIVLGAYSLRFERKLVRSKLQLGLAGMFGLLVLVNGPVTFTVLAPILYLIAAGGLAFMLQQWFTVFPKNPIARVLALILVGAAVGLSSYYNTYRYFVAWPGNPDTKAAFVETNLVK